jgi:Ca2+-binding EF-hand superfamily protein
MDMRYAIAVLVLWLSVAGTAVMAQEKDVTDAADEGQVFESMDADGNGRVSWGEYSGRSEEPDMEERMRVYQRLDKDGDGLISHEEWMQDAGE